MGVPAAPRIDEQLRRYIAGADRRATPADVTRSVGDLAWELGFTRPSYQQVRVLLGRRVVRSVVAAGTPTSTGRVVLRTVLHAIDVLYEYPAPGLEKWYRQYARGP